MAKYQKYAEYKDSGVEWLGEIPSHWYTVSLKMLIDVRDGTHDTPSYVEPNFSTYPLVTSKDVTSGRVDLSECKHISEFDYLNIIKRSGVSKGDILMPMIGTVGSPVLVEEVLEIAIKNLALFKTSISNEKLNSKFLFYFLNSEECEIQFSLEGKGGVQNFVSLGTLRNLVLPLTKINEQTQIANFLDHETAKIDSLIAKQEKLIELLKEKRQAVISHAVTKGLNPDVNMKDSGVEWLGQVPEHWQKAKLVSVADGTKGCFVNGPFGSDLLAHELRDEGVPVVYIRDIKPTGYKRKSTVHVTEKKAQQLEVCKVSADDVIISKVGDPPGDACLYPRGEPDAIITQDVIRIRVDQSQFSPKFIVYLLNSDFGRLVMDNISVEGTRKRVSLGDFKDTRFIFPQLKEQQLIAEYLEQECCAIDSIINKAQHAINLSQERRTALISSAVTGKINVTNWQNPNHNNNEANTELGA